MRDQLVPQERVMTIQEALAGFINEEVVNELGEFHYGGEILDQRSKYSNIVI